MYDYKCIDRISYGFLIDKNYFLSLSDSNRKQKDNMYMYAERRPQVTQNSSNAAHWLIHFILEYCYFLSPINV